MRRIFKPKEHPDDAGARLPLHRHQEDAIRRTHGDRSYVLTTGTGSGKRLAYIIPIVDPVLGTGSGSGIKAIVVYPMNALANSKMGELEEFLTFGYSASQSPVRYERYTGREPEEKLVSGGVPLGKGEITVRPDGDEKLSAAGPASRRA